MSLFDIIRCRLTIEYRVEDLSQVPYDVIEKWWYDDLWKIPRIRKIMNMYHLTPCAYDINTLMEIQDMNDTKEQFLKLLKSRLEEYG